MLCEKKKIIKIAKSVLVLKCSICNKQKYINWPQSHLNQLSHTNFTIFLKNLLSNKSLRKLVKKMKFSIKKVRLSLVTVFVFYFQKLVFGNIKKKTIFLYFWNKKHVWLVEIKKKKKSVLVLKCSICNKQKYINWPQSHLNQLSHINFTIFFRIYFPTKVLENWWRKWNSVLKK